MKNYTLIEPRNIELINKESHVLAENFAKVRITKAGIENFDLNVYCGKVPVSYPIVLGKQGVGVISEISEPNGKGLKKGDKVYIKPHIACMECFQCKTGKPSFCTNMKVFGKNIDGLLVDFINVPVSNIEKLPDQINESDAIFLDHISIGLEIFDLLKTVKGEYITIIGANVLGNIISQLAIYYHAVPILIDDIEDNLKKAKECGVYYTIGKDDDPHKIINQITGGRMSKYLIYSADSNYEINKIINLTSEGATLVLNNFSNCKAEGKIDLKNILGKNLKIMSINNGLNFLQSAINMLFTKSVTVSNLVTKSIKFNEVTEAFKDNNDKPQNELFQVLVDCLV